jgi:hypothetical protein
MYGKSFLTQSSTGVTLYDTVGSARGEPVFKWVVPKGRGGLLKGQFYMKLQLFDSVGVHMANSSLLRFVYYGVEDLIWSYPLGNPQPYQPWGTVSLEKQDDDRYKAALVVDLGGVTLPLIEDEILALEIQHASATLDKTYTLFSIEYYETRPEDLRALCAERRARFGR